MSPQFASRLGVAGGTLAVVALAACVYAFILPYRLSPTQMALLDAAVIAQFVGPLFSLALGIAALRGDARSRRLGFAAIILAVVAFLLAFITPQVHAVSGMVFRTRHNKKGM